jgi:DNA-binding winged helix-turn-helix (wHTH) protein
VSTLAGFQIGFGAASGRIDFRTTNPKNRTKLIERLGDDPGSDLLYLFDKFVLDTDIRELRSGSGIVSVEPQVFDLLAFLIRNRDRVVSREELLESVWAGRTVSESTLGSRMNAARAAIGDSGEAQRLIRTLPRVGFRFVGEVREDEAAQAPPRPQTSPPEQRPAASARPRPRSRNSIPQSCPCSIRTSARRSPTMRSSRATRHSRSRP